MAETYRARIPFESLDPLTIGASDDESKVYREELELEFPAVNLLAAIYPQEPEPVWNTTQAAGQALASPTSGASFAELLDGAGSVAVIGPLGLGLEVEGLAYGLLRSTHDFREGVEAFGEKRPPKFEGR